MNPQSLIKPSAHNQALSSSDTDPQHSPDVGLPVVCTPKPEQSTCSLPVEQSANHDAPHSILASSLLVHVPQDATVPSVVQHYHVPCPPVICGVNPVSTSINTLNQPSPLLSDAEASDCPDPQKQMTASLKKHKLLKKCHRHLKRLLRNPGGSRTSENGPVVYTCQRDDIPSVDHRQCLLNHLRLEEMQSKYSSLSEEMASLRRQLVAVQHAFTSLRTMLLASFTSSNTDHLEVPSLNGITNPSSEDLLTSSLISSGDNRGVFINNFCLNSEPPPVKVLPASLNTGPQLPVTFTQAFGSTLANIVTTDPSKMTASTTWYPPSVFGEILIPRMSEAGKTSATSNWSTFSVDPTAVGPTRRSPLLSTDQTSLTAEANEVVSMDEAENFAQRSQSKPDGIVDSPLPDESSHPLVVSIPSVTQPTGLSVSPNDVWSPSVTLDTAKVVDEVRRRLLFLNVSRRMLSSELKGTNYRTLSYLLRKPKPWSQLSSHAREIYLQLDTWLKSDANSAGGTQGTFAACESPFTTAPRSLQSDCPSPWTVSGTDETPASQDLLDDSDNPGEPVLPSPLEASISPNSFSSMPTMDSANEQDRCISDVQHGSSSILATVLTNLTAPNRNTSAHQYATRKSSRQLDLETQRRISDILSAARRAMEEEKTCTDDGDDTKRKKRAVISDSKPHVSQALGVDVSNSCSSADQQSAAFSNSSLSVTHLTPKTEALRNAAVSSNHGLASSYQSTQLSAIPTLPTVMSTSVAQPMQSEFSCSGPPAHDQFGSLPSSAATGARPGVMSGQVSFSELVQLLAAQAAHKQVTVLPNSKENSMVSGTTIHLGRRLAQPIHSLKVSCDPIVVANGNDTAPPCTLPPLLSAPSMPVILVPPCSLSEPVVASPPMPALVQISGIPLQAGTQSNATSLLTPLQQTLLLLAAATNSGPQTITVDNTNNLPGHELRVSASSNFEGHEPPRLNGQHHTNNLDATFSGIEASKSSADSGSNTFSESSVQLSQKTIASLSSLTFQGLTAADVDTLASGLPELDTWDLCIRTKNYLRRHNVSQRLFAEAVFGMSEAWVNDLLNRTERWASLTPRSRLAYARLYVWLQQPNPMEPIVEALINRQALFRSLPANNSQNVPLIDLTSERDVSNSRTATVPNMETLNARKRPALTQSIPGSRNTPVKIAKSEPPPGPILPKDGSRSSEQLDEYERQSLFDIAKAAAVAMQRATSSGLMKFARSRGQSEDSPAKSTNSSRSNTPLKTDAPRCLLLESNTHVRPLVLSPAKSSPGRNRIVFTPAQKEALVATFNRHPYPPVDKLRELARQLDLNYKTVLHWFHNRRMRSPKPLLTLDRNTSTVNVFTGTNVQQQPTVDNPSSANDVCNSNTEPTNQCQSNCGNGTFSGVAQLAHSNRRKRPDPARFITHRLS
ncbi:hypothetical protein CRM22_007643 [Opisthorchis felineus]|uniref:DNA-binding protein SATB n=1 Tax=Opisthorchis felineus TaxID=147828 RepID=A0A4S2LH11_OPIFE|nr:hypothetical protein CRM22_007643 [Opisthorchis felineus]TGZ62077.1 hypothetical protein CRM22_007643 [Opisthorchis felineus]